MPTPSMRCGKLSLGVLLTTCLFLAASSSIAHAQEVPPETTAEGEARGVTLESERLLGEATRLFTEDANFEEAGLAFQASYDIAPNWKALNGIALVRQEQGRYVLAVEIYRQLREEFGAQLTAKQSDTVTRRLANLGKRVSMLVISTQQVGVEVSVDGRSLGIGPLQTEVLLLPGSHMVVATRDGDQPWNQALELAAGSNTKLAVKLETLKVVLEVRHEKLVRRWPTYVPWVAAASSAGLLSLGALLDYSANQDYKDFDRAVALAAGSPPSSAQVDTASRQSGQTKSLVAKSMYGLGAAAAVTGTILWILNQPRAARDVQLSASPEGVALSFRFP